MDREDQTRITFETFPTASPFESRAYSSITIEWNGVMPMPPAMKTSVLECHTMDWIATAIPIALRPALLVVVCAAIRAINIHGDVA